MKTVMRYLINIIGIVIILSSTFTVISIVKWIFVLDNKLLLLTVLSTIVLSLALLALFLIYVYLDKKEKLDIID